MGKEEHEITAFTIGSAGAVGLSRWAVRFRRASPRTTAPVEEENRREEAATGIPKAAESPDEGPVTVAPHSSLVLRVARALCGCRNGKRSAVPFDQLPEAEQNAYCDQAQAAL